MAIDCHVQDPVSSAIRLFASKLISDLRMDREGSGIITAD